LLCVRLVSENRKTVIPVYVVSRNESPVAGSGAAHPLSGGDGGSVRKFFVGAVEGKPGMGSVS